MADAKVEVEITGQSASVVDAMRQASESVQEGVAKMKSRLDELSATFSMVGRIMSAATAVLAGGAMFKHAIDETKEFTADSLRLAKTLGMGVSDASAFAMAIDDVGGTTDDAIGAAQGLTRQLKTNESGLNSLGIATRDSAGNLLGMDAIMMDAIKTVNEYKEGTDRNLAAQVAFGRGASATSPIFKLQQEEMQQSKKDAEELGLVVGTQGVADYKAYRGAMNDAGDVMQGFSKAIGDALMPVLTEMAEWFRAIGPYAIQILRTAMADLVSAFWGLYAAVSVTWELIKAMVASIAEPLARIGMAMRHALTGNMVAAKEDLAGIGQGLVNTWDNAFDNIVAKATKARDKMAAAFADPKGDAPKSGSADDGRTYDAPDKDAGSDLRQKEWAASLEQMKEASGAFRKADIAADIAYWSAKLETVGTATVKDRELRSKVEHEIYGLKQKLLAQENALAGEAVNQRRAMGLLEIDAERQKLGQMVQLGQISKADELQGLAVLEGRKFAIEQAALEARLKLAQADKVARAKLADELLQLRAKHIQAEAKLEGDQAIELLTQKTALADEAINQTRAMGLLEVDAEREKYALMVKMGEMTNAQELTALMALEDRKYMVEAAALKARLKLAELDHVARARLDNELVQLQARHAQETAKIEGAQALATQKKWGDAYKAVSSGLQSSIAGLLNGTMTLAGAFKNLMGSIGDSLANLAAKNIANILEQAAVTKGASLKNVLGSAKEAGAAAWASAAKIPYVGWILGPAAGAAAFAGTMAFASASKGYDIPAGVNPMTQLHEQEMVLPKEQANVIRDLAGGGGGGGGGGHTFQINALDGPSFSSFLRNGGARQITEAVSRGLK